MATMMERAGTRDRIDVGPISKTMTAAVFVGPGRIELQEKPVPEVGPGEALIRVTTTTICGTDLHILKGEYPVRPGLIVGQSRWA